MTSENVQDIYELTPMQHGLLFDSVTGGDSGMYLIQLEISLSGELSRPDLERAWALTVERHPILRTSFHWEGLPKPLQVVQAGAALDLPFEDWSGLPPDEREQRIATYLEEDRQYGIDFEEAPLMRLALFQVGEDSYRLIWTLHHILMEGWSASLVLDEVRAHYRARRGGAPASLGEHRAYRDFVTWCQAQDAARAEAFWREGLAGLTGPTHLGIDQRPTGMHAPVLDFDERKLALSAESSSALRAFAKQHGLTLNTVVQGAWALLLSRYSGQRDVVFGAMVSGRSVPLEGVDSIVGLFVNILPARVEVGAERPLVEWLRDLQERQVRQREFEYISLADVKRWSEVPAGLPLFESLLVFENWAGDLTVADWGPGLASGEVRGHHGSPGHPMMVTVVPGERLELSITYDLQRFEALSVERLLDNFRVLLGALPAEPDRRLGELPFLSAGEAALLDGFNDTATDDGTHGWVHEQVAARCAERAAAPALRFEERTLSYGELEREVVAMARRLRRAGVGPGSLAALCVERSPGMVTSLLAILRLGAAYVPLDPMYPAARIAYILEDCGADVLVTERAFADGLPEHGASVLLLDEAADEAADQEADASGDAPPAPTLTGDELAYVIYTSGSTGKPKGVEITHRSLANFLDAMRREPGLGPDDVLVAVTTLAFDIAGLELYLPLTTGAQLVLASRAAAADASALTELLSDTGATVMQATPATWRMLIQVGWPGRAELKVLCGGEALPPELAAELLPRCAELWNMYGPTETTIWSTTARIEAGQRITVGRPIGNTQLHVLDERLSRLPIGVTGELYIGGKGLARGYRGRRDLTAERFVPDPFAGGSAKGAPASEGQSADARLYRTGDLARFTADGSLEIQGRIDHQVKIRGFRIELGEIEATLERREDVAECVVVARDDGRTGARLVAYIVSAPGHELDSGALRAGLRESLPDYMLPAVFVAMDELPRTPNGKLDRRALPAPDASHVLHDHGYEAPRTALEKQLAELWCSVLELDRVGLRDNFFDLGGHSLLLMPVISGLKEQLGVRVEPGELVLPTLGQLATLCEERMASPPEEAPGGRRRGLVGRLFKAVRGSSPDGRDRP